MTQEQHLAVLKSASLKAVHARTHTHNAMSSHTPLYHSEHFPTPGSTQGVLLTLFARANVPMQQVVLDPGLPCLAAEQH